HAERVVVPEAVELRAAVADRGARHERVVARRRVRPDPGRRRNQRLPRPQAELDQAERQGDPEGQQGGPEQATGTPGPRRLRRRAARLVQVAGPPVIRPVYSTSGPLRASSSGRSPDDTATARSCATFGVSRVTRDALG